MPLIYRAGNLVEAQLVVDELKAGGMQAHVTGSYLSGAIGELPPTEVIGVWLLEAQHTERARSIMTTMKPAASCLLPTGIARSARKSWAGSSARAGIVERGKPES